MAQLSINEAWNETAAFVKREARLLFPIAFLLVALPGAVLQLAMPQPAPGEPPEPGLWLLMVPVAVALGMAGTIALSYLALRSGASVAEALQVGARRFLILLGASLLVGLAAAAVAIPVIIVIGAAAFAGGSAAAAAGVAVLGALVALVLLLALWVRLMLMTPVAAVEPGGPIALIRRSWALTSGHFWRLLGFALLALVAAMVAMAAVTAVVGLVILLLAGPAEPNSLSMILLLLVSALLQAVISMLLATMIARIYAQLSGFGTRDVFA